MGVSIKRQYIIFFGKMQYLQGKMEKIGKNKGKSGKFTKKIQRHGNFVQLAKA